MSIIIKGLNMPKEGEHILALIKNDGKCSYFEETAFLRIMKTTEAIQIPTPHGRLIDADKLADDLQADGEEFGEELKLNCASWLQSNANATILEAEE